jgi:hypothetical protein
VIEQGKRRIRQEIENAKPGQRWAKAPDQDRFIFTSFNDETDDQDLFASKYVRTGREVLK